MSVSDEKILKTKELERIADDLQGVREVQSIYGEMASSNYEILLIANRESLQLVKQRIEELIKRLDEFPNENKERQYALMVNNANPNQPFFMDAITKNAVIDAFKGVIPSLDNQLEQAYISKKAELDAL